MLLSRFQAQPLLDARTAGSRVVVTSLDLGLHSVQVDLDEQGVQLPEGRHLTWTDVQTVADSELVCYRIGSDGLEPIRSYSEETQRTYQLMPTAGAPALLISGFVMHRFRDVTPAEGAREMVRALGPIRGRLLDTATGLGYAAIEAARFAEQVVTIELDPEARAMARRNPWSAPLFAHPKIELLSGDSSQVVPTLPAGSFHSVLHDPPAINLAGELYAETFYAQVYRVLAPRGRFFHYIGDPGSSSGARVTQGVVKRLRAVGFAKIVPQPRAFGVLACK